MREVCPWFLDCRRKCRGALARDLHAGAVRMDNKRGEAKAGYVSPDAELAWSPWL
jgi:hypothetical protein